jgi:hypothetical protein
VNEMWFCCCSYYVSLGLAAMCFIAVVVMFCGFVAMVMCRSSLQIESGYRLHGVTTVDTGHWTVHSAHINLVVIQSLSSTTESIPSLKPPL